MKQPSFEATPTKVDVEALPHRLTIISSPRLSLKLKGNPYSNLFSTSPATTPKCWANYWANLSTLNCQPGLVSLEVQVQETLGSKYSNEWNTNMLLKITHPTKTCTSFPKVSKDFLVWLTLVQEFPIASRFVRYWLNQGYLETSYSKELQIDLGSTLYDSSCLWKVQLPIQRSRPKIIFICNQKLVKERTQRSLVSYTISYLRCMVCK